MSEVQERINAQIEQVRQVADQHRLELTSKPGFGGVGEHGELSPAGRTSDDLADREQLDQEPEEAAPPKKKSPPKKEDEPVSEMLTTLRRFTRQAQRMLSQAE